MRSAYLMLVLVLSIETPVGLWLIGGLRHPRTGSFVAITGTPRRFVGNQSSMPKLLSLLLAWGGSLTFLVWIIPIGNRDSKEQNKQS